MKEKEVIKINDRPEGFQFRANNRWRRLPWYLMSIVLLAAVVLGSAIYYRVLANKQRVITENYSPQPEVFKPEVSGVNFLAQTDPFDNLVNILLLGCGGPDHPGGGLTDVIQVLSINPIRKKALIFSVPRDLYVDIDNFGFHKINTAYNLGQQLGHGQGGILVKKEIEQVLGIPIHYYIKVDFNGFVRIVDLLDGIDVCVDRSINDPAHDIYILSGCQEMDGQKALAYVRSRYSTSDFDRSSRQQKTIFAIKEKALKLNFLLNPLKINQALAILVGSLNTDIKISEMKQLSQLMAGLKKDQMATYVLDNRKDQLLYSTSRNGAYVLLPVGGDYQKIKKFVRKNLP